jgi:hypothetical protein
MKVLVAEVIAGQQDLICASLQRQPDNPGLEQVFSGVKLAPLLAEVSASL